MKDMFFRIFDANIILLDLISKMMLLIKYNIGKINFRKKDFILFILLIWILPVIGPNSVPGGQRRNINIFHNGK